MEKDRRQNGGDGGGGRRRDILAALRGLRYVKGEPTANLGNSHFYFLFDAEQPLESTFPFCPSIRPTARREPIEGACRGL